MKLKSLKLTTKQQTLQQEWNAIVNKHRAPLEKGAIAKGIKVKLQSYSKVSDLYIPPDRDSKRYKSVVTLGGHTNKLPDKVYTGDKMLGVSVLHKSNGIPVFRSEDILDIAKMRR